MSLPAERRRHPRVAIQQIVELRSTTYIGDDKAFSENLSLGGVLLMTRSSTPVGAEVTLRLALPPDIGKRSELCLLCRGIVLRRVETHRTAILAIEFSGHDVVAKTADQVGSESRIAQSEDAQHLPTQRIADQAPSDRSRSGVLTGWITRMFYGKKLLLFVLRLLRSDR